MSSKTPTLIHTEASLGWGGQEIRILTECKWFRDKGFRCILMANIDSRIFKAFEAEGFQCISVDFKKGTQLGDFFRCYKLFKKLKPELVGTHSNIDTRVALAAATAAGVARRVRYRHVSVPVKTSPWNRLIYRKFATSIITTANSITEDLTTKFSLPEGFAQTISTGVEDTSTTDRCDARQAVLRKLGLSDSSVLITQVSVLRGWKGHRDLMAAFNILAEFNPDLHLVLVGGGPGLKYLPDEAARFAARDRIHFLGHQKDPYRFFKAANVVTLASTGGEGVPQSALQCFACGSPFVGTRVGGIPDITVHGENGLLVSPNAPEELAGAIEKILTNPSLGASLAKNARRTFEQIGSISHMGDRLRKFLDL
ncbi:MAG TPA: glycosyltransferase family 4 protein [Opitutales bacterium]|nr:glycosyltransferase family 4 protein [Opitutales bacterium]